ncbi:MAG: pilus (MSHA type) biogenesis protein MshL [Gammaproteobacteria bacterium]
MTKSILPYAVLLGCALAGCTALVPAPPAPSPVHLDAGDPRHAEEIPEVVEQAPYLPAPEPLPETERYTVVVNEVPVKELLFAVARDAKVNVDVDPGIEGLVTLNAIDQTLPQILDRIARQVDVRYEIRNGNVIVSPDRPYFRTYQVDYVNLSRDSTGTINVATQIATTGAAVIGEGGGGSSGGGGNNNSTTAITNTANNRFWLTLTQNILAILGEPVAGGGAGGELPVNESVIPNPETGLINVRATAKQHEAIQGFIDKVMTSAQRQVLIEATVVEVSLNDNYQQGIDWNVLHEGSGIDIGQFLGGPGLGAAAANAALPATAAGTVTSFVMEYFNKGSGGPSIDVALRLLREFGDLKVLSSPRIMTLNNQTAVLKVVENFVYFEVDVEPGPTNPLTLATSVAVDTTAKTVPVGFVMSVTPQVNENDSINLTVRPTISRVTDQKQDPNPELQRGSVQLVNLVPQISVREMESVLRLNDRQIGVLGGLIQDSTDQQTDSVPLLSDIPLIGDSLFRSRTNNYGKTELVIFLRPVIVRSPSIDTDLESYRSYLGERKDPSRTY